MYPYTTTLRKLAAPTYISVYLSQALAVLDILSRMLAVSVPTFNPHPQMRWILDLSIWPSL